MAKKGQKKQTMGSVNTEDLLPVEPTEIQRHAWPILLLGNSSSSAHAVDKNRNMICVAQTGSGKTLTFSIPLVQHCAFVLQNSNIVCRGANVLGLVLVPTRELALQVSNQINKVVRVAQKEMKDNVLLDIIAIHGGVDKKDQIQRIIGESVGSDDSGADGRRGVVLAATTGRLVDLLQTKPEMLHSTRFLVIDEADRMALSAEICSQVDQIVASMPNFPTMTSSSSEFTSCLFSATLPRDNAIMAKFFGWVGSQATTIQLDNISIGKAQAVLPSAPDSDGSDSESKSVKKRNRQAVPLDMASIPANITQILHVCSTHKKPKKLITMVDKIRKDESKGKGRTKGLCLIFFARIKTLKYMKGLLEKEGHHRCVELHSGIPQRERERVVISFKSGKTPTMLATDVAARGLHVNNVRVVINYDFPGSLGEYVHRCGRAGRDKEPATVYGYFTRDLKGMAQDLHHLLKSTKAWIDPNLLALIPGAAETKDNEERKKKRRRKNTKRQPELKEPTSATATAGKRSKNNDVTKNGEEEEVDEFSHLSANRIVLKRASHVSEGDDSSSGVE